MTTFLDLIAAFNFVEHNTLLGKMKIYGFSSQSTNIIDSYLKGKNNDFRFIVTPDMSFYNPSYVISILIGKIDEESFK